MKKMAHVINTLAGGGSERVAIDIFECVDKNPERKEVAVAGRLIALRDQGKAAFGHIQDADGKLQVYFNADIFGEENYKQAMDLIDIGDIESMALALRKLYFDKVLRENLSKNALESAKRYNKDVFCKKYKDIIDLI